MNIWINYNHERDLISFSFSREMLLLTGNKKWKILARNRNEKNFSFSLFFVSISFLFSFFFSFLFLSFFSFVFLSFLSPYFLVSFSISREVLTSHLGLVSVRKIQVSLMVNKLNKKFSRTTNRVLL